MMRPFFRREAFRCVAGGAFSMVELLVVVAILGSLIAVSGAAYQKAMGKVSMAAEISAGKNLIQSYHLAATEHDGRLLFSRDPGAAGVLNAKGQPMGMSEPRSRYPFRLAPYFNYQMEGTILVGRNEAQIIKIMGGASGPMYDYGLSIFPAMGINRYLVGGSRLPGPEEEIQFARECVRTTAQADKSVLVFVSAGVDDVDGYEYVIAPQGPAGRWSGDGWTKDSAPNNFGHVDARFDGKAVAVFLDGSVKALSIDELRDMRLWSRNAALANDPNYKPQ